MLDSGLGALVLQTPRLLHVSVVYIGLIHLLSGPFLTSKDRRGEKLPGRGIGEKSPFDRGASGRDRLFALVGWGQTRVGVFLPEDATAVLDRTEWH